MIRYFVGDDIAGSQDQDDPGGYRTYHERSKLYPTVERLKAVQAITEAERLRPLDGARHRHRGRLLPLDVDPACAFDRSGAPTSLAAALAARRSVRSFTGGPLPIETVGRLLRGSYYPTGHVLIAGAELALRTVPSAGALYPVDVYVALNHVAGAARGVYRYLPLAGALEAIRLDDGIGDALAAVCAPAPQVSDAAGAVLLSAHFGRLDAKYEQRGYRYALLEAGHLAQVLCLGAAALGIGALCQGAFFDDQANALVRAGEASESVVYIVLFGALASGT
jgi:SagB-type dehydrogenase family enzyme